MPRVTAEQDDVRPGTAVTWSQDPPEYGATEQTHSKSSMSTLQHPESHSTPTMPKKVSFAAEVDEQQERISKESARREMCCSIQ